MTHNRRHLSITCVLNAVSAGCIPLENFCSIRDDQSSRRVLVLDSNADETAETVASFDISGTTTSAAVGACGNRLNPAAWWRLFRSLKTSGPQIVHAHHRASGLASGLFTRMFRPNDRFVYTLHGNLNRPGSSSYRPIQLIIMGLAHALVCNSHATADSIPRSFGFLRKRACVIYNGVDLSGIGAIRESRATPSTDAPYTICSVGRLVSLKQFDRLIDAVSELRIRSPRDVRLVIVGSGPQRKALEVAAEKSGVSDIVTFTGNLTRAHVYKQLAASDLFVMPSKSEGFCNAVVEAMAMGLPVLCSDIPALREVVDDTSGRHFPVEDGPALTNAILQFIDNPAEAEEMGRRGRQRAELMFSLGSSTERHVQLYERISRTP